MKTATIEFTDGTVTIEQTSPGSGDIAMIGRGHGGTHRLVVPWGETLTVADSIGGTIQNIDGNKLTLAYRQPHVIQVK